MINLKKIALGAAASAALFAAAGISPAAAGPTFSINPNVLATGAYGTSVDVNAFSGSSDALVRQITATTQHEEGWVRFSTFDSPTLGPLGPGDTGLIIGSGFGNAFYGLYVTFELDLTNVSNFNSAGTINAGDFKFKLWADVGTNTAFNLAANNGVGGTYASVGPAGTAGDRLLAVGQSVTTTGAGFQATGAPIFSAISNFILCDGALNSGTLGGVTVAAAGCQADGFNATSYFVAPVPFFELNFAAATQPSIPAASDISGNGAVGANVHLRNITLVTNFIAPVPEPISISLFGAGLAGAAAIGRRRKAKKA